MTTINLRNFYYYYTQDEFIEVSDEVAEAMFEAERQEKNYTERVRYNKAYYSLDMNDGIEREAAYINMTPQEILEHQLMRCQVCQALNSLPETQGRRIDAHLILGMSKVDIAKAECVSEKNVRQSIERGLQRMREYIKKYF